MPPPARFRDAALLYNPLAGRGRWKRARDLDRATDLLAAYGMRVTRLATTGPGSATALARQQLAAGRDLIIVCGGDGTINEVVNGMAGSAVPLALLPAGTGNALASALGLPWSIWRAAEYIPRGEVRRIALGQAGERYFVSMAGAGADGQLVYDLNRLGQPRFKFVRFVWEGYRQLFVYDFSYFDVHIGGEVFPVTQLVLGRLAYYAFPITPRADLFRDDFEVLLVLHHHRVRYFFYSLAVLTRTLHLFPEVRYLRARAVRAVPRQERVRVQTDAEVAGELPMEFSIVPGALSLLVPARAA